MFQKKTLTKQDLLLLKEKYPDSLEEQIKKVNNGYPVQYLIGEVEFLNTIIFVNENVLIPRFETEYLVDKILKKMAFYKNIPLKVLDIGTGSGCISIALSKNTNWVCTGVDISESALEVAKKNNSQNNTTVFFKKKDILNEKIEEEYDILVSNPPYIGKSETVDITVLFEPSIALYANDAGLEFYKKIMKEVKKEPLLIAFEIGETQGAYLIDFARNLFPTSKITLEKDLCGKDRYLFIEKDINHT